MSTLERRTCPFCGRSTAVQRPVRFLADPPYKVRLPGWRLQKHASASGRGPCAGSMKVIDGEPPSGTAAD